MKLFVQIMECHRCKVILQEELAAIGLNYSIAELEESEITEIGPEIKYEILKNTLRRFCLETMLDKRALLVAKLKTTIIEMVNHPDEVPRTKCSVYLSGKLNHNYNYLSGLFSRMHGSTLASFIIAQRIARAKELLVNNELTLTEIAWRLHYSSVAHLSNQFKKVAGTTPSCFRTTGHKRHEPDSGTTALNPALVGQRLPEGAGTTADHDHGVGMAG